MHPVSFATSLIAIRLEGLEVITIRLEAIACFHVHVCSTEAVLERLINLTNNLQ